MGLAPLAALLALTSLQPYAPDDRTLLLDHLDAAFTPDGKLTTSPEVVQAGGGVPVKGAEFQPGRYGQALRLKGLTNLTYPGAANLSLAAGVLEFDVALGFDASILAKDPPAELRNQFYFSATGPGPSRVSIYSTIGHLCLGVWDQGRQLVCYGDTLWDWKAGEWHNLSLRWGRQLELWVDGEPRITKDWNGLFGPVDAKPEQVRLIFGSLIGTSGVHSEFALDEIRILGPGGEQVPDYPTLAIPKITAPTLDGRLEPAEWADAARTTGFVGLNDPTLVEDQTIVYAGWDNDALYFAFDATDPQQRPIVAMQTERDSQVYREDAIDIFLQPGPEVYPYYQLVTNALGTVYDSRVDPANDGQKHDARFNPDWEHVAWKGEGRWSLEVRIPFASLDGQPTPAHGDRWRVNFARDADAASRLSSWAYPSGNFHLTEAFGELIFRDSGRAMRVELPGGWNLGQVSPRLDLAGRELDPPVTVRAKVTDESGKAIVETQDDLVDIRSSAVAVPPLVSGLYQVTLQAGTAEELFYSQRIAFRVDKPYDIQVAGYPYLGVLEVIANVAGLDNAAGVTARSRLQRGEEVVGEAVATEFPHGRGIARIPIAELPAGSYRVVSEAIAPDGTVKATAEAAFEQYPRPSWWRSEAGAEPTVPEPWTPVAETAGDLSVWGRVYEHGHEALPRQIENQNEAVLAAPIRLILSAGGATADLARLPATTGEAAEVAVTRTSTGEVGGVAVALTSRTEFDGMQRYDLTLTPSGRANLEALTLELPVRREVARFLLASSGTSATTTEVGDEPQRFAFKPLLWMGNDDLGLTWFAESDQHWAPRDEGMLEIVPAGDEVVLRAAMVRQPLAIDGPVTYTFGLQATPVKDAHAGDPFWFRFTGPLGPLDKLDDPAAAGKLREFLTYPAAGNALPAAGTLEAWIKPTSLGSSARDTLHLLGPNGRVSLAYLCIDPKPSLILTVKNGEQTATQTFRAVDLPLTDFGHVALTWHAAGVTLHAGGQQVGHLPLTMPDGLQEIRLGAADQWRSYPDMIVDELQISRTVRYPGETFQVPSEPFAPDGETLLLDHLDGGFRPDGEDAETRPEVISGQSGELGGVPSIGSRFVPGRFGQALEFGWDSTTTSLTALAQWGGNAWLHWWWMENPPGGTYGWPPPLHRVPEMGNPKEQLAALRAEGIRVSPYVAYYGIGAPSPESRQFGAEWARLPLSTQPAEPPDGHYFLAVCGNSGYADYLAAGTEYTLRELGYHGTYTDGNGHVFPCRNQHHGCGYVDEAGTLRSTWPIFATREYHKRMYRLVHRHDPAGYTVNHVSYDLFIPVMAFTDVYYSGEHEQYEDLTKFRVRWQGRQWGLWTTLLGGDSHSFEALHNTWSLLHGISVWPQGNLGRNDVLRKTVNIWQTYDRFGYREAEWIPYYRAEKWVKAADERVLVSVYRHPDGRALLVIGNLDKSLVETTVTIDPAGLGLKNGTARNALSERTLPLADGKLTVRLRPNAMILAWLE